MNLYVLNISHEWGLFLMQFTLLLSGFLFFSIVNYLVNDGALNMSFK